MGLSKMSLSLPFFFIINLRERKGERNMDLFFNSFMHSLVVSCMCPDWRPSLRTWHIEMML